MVLDRRTSINAKFLAIKLAESGLVCSTWGLGVVLRIHLNSFPLEQGDGQPFDALAAAGGW